MSQKNILSRGETTKTTIYHDEEVDGSVVHLLEGGVVRGGEGGDDVVESITREFYKCYINELPGELNLLNL